MQRFLLAIDQGTTSTRATVYDQKLRSKGFGQQEIDVLFPYPGWVETDLTQIWERTESCIQRALRDAGIKRNQVSAIGITNQRETVGLWSRGDGKPVHRAIVWQDRRTADFCAELKDKGWEARVREVTGLVLDPYFSAGKLRWLLDHVPSARRRAARGELAAGTIDSWLVFKLTGHAIHVTDASNASRTSLLSLRSVSWNEEMLELFAIPGALLPQVAPSSQVYGTTKGMRSLPDGIPIAGMAGDQQAALFGQGCFEAGEAKCTYGTGAFLLMNTGLRPRKSTSGLLTTIAWRLGGKTTYALEGSAFVAGAAVQWLRDGLGLIRRSSDVDALAKKVPDSGGVIFVPALTGLGAPHWRPEARGLMKGITRGTTSAHIARAVLEGIAFQIRDLVQAMRSDSKRALPRFRVDGGAAQSDMLMQFQADLLGIPLERPVRLETTSLGAAMLAGLGIGIWNSPQAVVATTAPAGDLRVFKPKMGASERERRLAAWARAVASA